MGLVVLYGYVRYPAGTLVLFGHMNLYVGMYLLFSVAMSWLVSAFWGDAISGRVSRSGRPLVTRKEALIFSMAVAGAVGLTLGTFPRQIQEVDGFVRNMHSGVPVEKIQSGMTTYMVCGGNFLSVDPVLAMALRPQLAP